MLVLSNQKKVRQTSENSADDRVKPKRAENP